VLVSCREVKRREAGGKASPNASSEGKVVKSGALAGTKTDTHTHRSLSSLSYKGKEKGKKQIQCCISFLPAMQSTTEPVALLASVQSAGIGRRLKHGSRDFDFEFIFVEYYTYINTQATRTVLLRLGFQLA